VLDLYPDQKEIDLPDDNIFEMVSDRLSVCQAGALLREVPYFDLLYSNSMCRQSSIPTSILIELLLSGGILNECTQMSLSLFTSAIRLDIVTRMKYLCSGVKKAVCLDTDRGHRSLTLMPW